MPRAKDYYSRKARSEGYYARSAYKLKELNKRFRLIRRGSSVLDLGCAPGGWMQVIKEIVGKKGYLLGIDIKPMKDVEHAEFILGDVNDSALLDRINRKFDAVVSDLAPSTTGIAELDHELSIGLARRALDIAKKRLKKNGGFLCKLFQGAHFQGYLADVKKSFAFVRAIRPKATKKGSKEVYVIAKGF